MSGRRAANRIRGPQSALTDFLAANNISAAQIRDDYERRRREAEGDTNDSGEGASNQQGGGEDEVGEADITVAGASGDVGKDEDDEGDEEEEEEVTSKKRKRSSNKVALEKIKKQKAAAAKKSKSKKKKGKKGDSDDEDDDDDYDDDEFARDMYKKSRPAPGQFANCEICSKRFTVTPYSKEGPDGGLLCTPCGKEMAKGLKKEQRAAKKPAGRKRRKIESDRLDGVAAGGAKSLQQLCIEKLVKHYDQIDELGDMPQPVLERLSEIFSKKRVLKSNTLPLFLRPDLDSVVVHDAAYLEPEDYQQIFAVVPNMKRLVLGNACQLKNDGMDYMLERCHQIRHLHLYAANLVTTDMWKRVFEEIGERLEVIKLTCLDAAFEDETVSIMVDNCPNIQRVKLELCRRIGDDAVAALAKLKRLQHVSLQINHQVSTNTLVSLVTERGALLETLSLDKFVDADDSLLDAIHTHCTRLRKLRISENDTINDSAFKALFTDWANPALSFIDVNSTRDVDNNNPTGPEEPKGMASDGFRAMMAHSGSSLKHLDIASCRHIELSAFMDVFNGAQSYPSLEYINISFCNKVDTSIVAGIFKSCPALKKVVAFGCFNVQDVVVPRAIALIGVPRAQDAIEQFGVGIGVEEAIGRMVEVGA